MTIRRVLDHDLEGRLEGREARREARPWRWVRGALLLAAAAGCQAAAPGDELAGDRDPRASLAALPEATLLLAGDDGAPRWIAGELGRIDPAHEDGPGAADRALRAALPPILAPFGLADEDLVLRKVHVDERGGRHFRYDQRLGGLPVIGGDLAVHVDVKGAIVGVNGLPRPAGAAAPGAPPIAEGAARLTIANDARWASLAGRAITASRRVYLQTPEGALHEAYEQIVEGVRAGARGPEPVRDRVYVDVHRGDVVAVHPMIHHALYRRIYSDTTLARVEGDPPTGDPDVDGAYDNLGTTYHAYHHFWGRDSYDNAGADLVAVVHYGTNYCNAFWNGSQMVFGDGHPQLGCGPLARALDVAAHELTHAVTQHESNLVYTGEPGGLNEAYSDMFAAFTEAFGDGGGDGTLAIDDETFLIADEVLAPFLRDMCDPFADGASRDVWTPDLGTIDVHYSSGPQNLAFCLLAKGGTHPRGKTTNDVPAIGLEAAARIFYYAQVALLTSNTNYAGMRAAALLAAQALGYDQATQDAVACAYAAIKVGEAPASCGGTQPPPPDGVLQNGVPVTGISDSVAGNFRYWRLDVPAGQTQLTFTISGGSGDVDMYVHFGAKPTTTVYQCRPYLTGNSESCLFVPPQAGTYWVGLRTYAPYAGVTLTGVYGDGPLDPYLQNGVPVTNLSGAAGSARYFRIAVPAGKQLSVKTSGGTGDVDLYTRFGARPTTATYACRPYLTGNNEACVHAAGATTGDWYILLRGFTAYSGVSLVGSY